jgi:recombinational DNA repair protein (RecF pathway)
MNTPSIKRKCTNCRLTLDLDAFSVKRDGTIKKYCDHCLAISARHYNQVTKIKNKILKNIGLKEYKPV